MECRDILNLIALIVIPIVAVVIGHHLQTRAKKREDKMRVFESMMASRLFGMDANTVRAANMIPIVYAKDKAVREKWSAFYGALCVQNPSEDQLSNIEAKREALLKVMAKSLGYKDRISQQALDERYVPKGLTDMAARNRMQQEAYDTVLQEAALRLMTGQPFPRI